MKLTDQQRAAQTALQEAIEAHVRAWKPADEDGLLVDWACVAQLTRFDEEGDRESAYHLIYSGGQMDEHRAVGLFDYAIHLIKFGMPEDDDSEA